MPFVRLPATSALDKMISWLACREGVERAHQVAGGNLEISGLPGGGDRVAASQSAIAAAVPQSYIESRRPQREIDPAKKMIGRHDGNAKL